MDIVINIEAFQCITPIINQTYRNDEYTYSFNWVWSNYSNQGVTSRVRLYYTGDGNPEQEYTLSNIPNNANNFSITLPSYDITTFRIVFTVNDGNLCSNEFLIPYSQIIV